MNFDKHDLFRNVVPGFVFLIVVLSFYGFSGTLKNIQDNQGTLVALVAGFPLGFIIYNIYRIVFHIGVGEQRMMEEDDAEIMRKIVKEKTLFVENEFDKKEEKNKALSHFLLAILNDTQFWKERNDFLSSYIHSLGASVLAIFLALVFMVFVKTDKSFQSLDLLIFWFAVAIIFYLGRKAIKNALKISIEVCMTINRNDINNRLSKNREK